MSLWKMGLGDPARFAIEIAFERDPDAGFWSEPEMERSWGSFRIWVDGLNLCAHQEMGERIESVHWYLLPLLEFFVDRWDPLFHEQRLPRAGMVGRDAWSALSEHDWPPHGLAEAEEDEWLHDWRSWWSRHCLVAARAGGIFPDLVLRRWGQDLELSWGPESSTGAPDHFRFLHSPGYVRLEPGIVAEPLHSVIGAAIDQLLGWLPESNRLHDLRDRYRRLATPSTRDERLAWLAGLVERDWREFVEKATVRFGNSKTDEALTSILGFDQEPSLVLEGSCRAAIMFGSLSPTLAVDDRLVVAEEQIHAYEAARDELPVDRMAKTCPLEIPPYQQGYELATDVLESSQVGDSSGAVPIESLLDDLGITVTEIHLGDPNLRGLAFVSPCHRPTISINLEHPANRHDAGRRFTLAHELCHLLHDRARGRELALASGPWTSLDVEQRANAFAAMLLMPADRLLSLLDELGPERDERQVREIAKRMRVGFRSALDHLTNLGFLQPSDREAIDAELDY